MTPQTLYDQLLELRLREARRGHLLVDLVGLRLRLDQDLFDLKGGEAQDLCLIQRPELRVSQRRLAQHVLDLTAQLHLLRQRVEVVAGESLGAQRGSTRAHNAPEEKKEKKNN